jgi:hypothetical protein
MTMQRRIVVARLGVVSPLSRGRHYATCGHRKRLAKNRAETAKTQINRPRFIVA